METGGEFPAGHGRMVRIPRGEVRLCAGCAGKGITGEKMGMFEPA